MTYIVTYRSRYFPFEGDRKVRMNANSKKEVRDNWHDRMGTVEYRIIKVDQVKK